MSPKKGSGKICPHCRGIPNYLEEFKKYYCFSCNKYIEPIDSAAIEEPIPFSEKVRLKETPMICPKCEKKADFIMKYDRYYCYSCKEYIAPPKKEEAEIVKKEGELEKTEEVKEPEEGLSTEEEKDLDEYISELDTLSHEPGPEEDLLEGKKKDFSDYRYRSRMLKATVMPLIFGFVSLAMLNSNVLQFPKYYEYKVTIILAGFIMGFGVLTGITTVNLVRAKKNQKEGCELNNIMGYIGFLPFIVVVFALTLFDSLSTAWQFAVGFFFAPVFPILIIAAVETGSKGKFYIRELVDDPSFGRKLVFVR